MSTRSFLVSVGILAVAFAAPALAQEVSGGGESLIVDTSPAPSVLPDGRTHAELSNRQVLMATDVSHPFHRVTITCAGACMMQAGETTGSCSGGCAGQDPDGDTITFSWNGQDKGGWTLTGGTGKWSKASGKGTWKSTDPIGAGFLRNEWTGTIRMK